MIMELFPEDAEGEEEYGKCRKHPSSTRAGVCPVCLTNRLILLCPDCAHLRPCACLHPSTDSSSSSSSSSSSFSYPPFSKSGASVGSVARMSFLIESEPAFRRSRSAAFPFIRAAKSGYKSAGNLPPPPPEPWNSSSSSASFWSFLKAAKTKRRAEDGKKSSSATKKQMQRSRSVGFSCYSDPKKEISGRDVRLKALWGWRLPSPIKIFGYPKTMKVVHDRATLIRV
ncbi:hypothetical protein MRB53_003527 [Persea americana]|uniref:Uncharacterized protein n=1 Tax=Persea americana TaxID=3435 RepID=A0ACC2MZ92_PERAE|nr:hypothetical protein MRB53_003527 [Persea americana]